jgi:hypothetical protein
MKLKKRTLILVGCLCAALLGLVAGIYIMNSNHITGTVTQKATMTLYLDESTSNGTTLVEGTQHQLTAIISDSSNPQVTFYNLGSAIGSVTPVTGNATLLYTIPIGSTTFDFSAQATHS